MPQPRKGPPINTLSPPDTGIPSSGSRSPSSSIPRSASPSSGFSQLFKPKQWFQRSNSGGAIPARTSISSMDPRPSTSSARKPKISHPTDPRPILDQLRPEPVLAVPSASRSVYDLSLARTATMLDDGPGLSNHEPSSPTRSQSPRGLGDLRNLARKPWSKSADDLGRLSLSTSSTLSPIDTSFHDKVQNYRNRRNDSVGSSATATPPSHSPQSSTSYPFPVINTTNVETPSSSPPGRSGILTATSSPVSSGPSPVTPSSQSPGHVHTRSHSFTPRLPSKLASPKLGIVPPSPKRKGGFSSSETELPKDKSGSSGSGSSGRPAFPFSFGGSSSGRSVSPLSTDAPSPLDRPGTSASLLAPPTIVEPGSDDQDFKNDKRTSQLVYNQGFINRLMDFSPASMNSRAHQSYMSGNGGLALAKGWKPFKVVLKGSKLYFYKPPSDRSTAVKELFPTELVVTLNEEDVPDNDVEKPKEAGSRGGKGKERDDGRRKRAFWGSSTHPSLVLTDGVVEGGTYEALVHEAVFHTTFRNDEGSPDQSELSSSQSSSLCDFSSAIVCALPSAIDRAQFEIEFRRCCSMLVDTSGADTTKQEKARKKVHWLADLYVTYHGTPIDGAAWDTWCSATIPNVQLGDVASKPAGLPQSTSTQALFAPSPEMPSTSPAGLAGSPDLGAFSPRPGGSDRMMSLLDALGDRPQQKRSASTFTKTLQNSLDRGGFSRDILMSLDTHVVARSLYVHNLQALQNAPHNVTVASCLNAEQADTIEVESVAPNANTRSPLDAFFGTDEHPHWLTKLILLQILISESPTFQSSQFPGRSVDERHPRTPSRSEVVSAWARIGEVCRRTGDECSWRAIFAALTSRPIARLDKIWKRVDGDALRVVQSWVYPLEGAEASRTVEPKTIPWVGDRVSLLHSALEAVSKGETGELAVDQMYAAWRAFDSLRTDFSLAFRKGDTERHNDAEDVEALAAHWHAVSSVGVANAGTQPKLRRIEQFMSLSLAVEPRRKGLFEPFYWTRPAIQHNFHPLTPLLFPEPLATTTYINRSLIQRGRLDSTASTMSIQDLQYLRELHGGLQQKPPQDSTKVNGFDLGGTVIIVYDGELMLLVQPADNNSPSRASSRPPSRPPSSVIDSPPPERSNFSRNPSVRVKPGHKGLERKPSQLRRSSLPALSKKPSFEPADPPSERPIRVVIQAGTLDRLVTVLVEGLHGVSVSVADDNGEMPLNDKKTRELRVDMEDFCKVWWTTFRSFVTPHVFFELLRKKYISAQVTTATPSASEVAAVVRARTEVLETISRWIHEGGGAQDALDDPQLHASLMSFFNNPTEHTPSADASGDANVQRGFATINENRKAVLISFSLQTMRPITRNMSGSELFLDPSPSPSFGPDPPDIDQIKPEALVSNIDAMAAAAFRNVTQEDLFVAADILEVQSADRTGWFLSRDPSAISDEVEIQNIHGYLQDVEPSPLISELGQESLYRHLPPSIRGCIRAFTIIRKWLVSKLAASKIGLKSRQARMETLLRAIEVARRRNAEPGDVELATEKPVPRSFAEGVLVSAVLAVESRMYHRAWQTLAASRGVMCDSLTSLLSKPTTNITTSRDPLTIDVGWLLERVLEVISMPDILEQDGLSLVNFDKRRSLYGLVNNVGSGAHRKARHRLEVSRRDFERLNNIEQELIIVHFDWRTIREEAYREASQTPSTALRKQPRPFSLLVAMQQDKSKRDRSLRDRLTREKRQEQHKLDKREEYINKAMHVRKPQHTGPKYHRTKKSSVSSAFMQFMRPISSAFTSETATTTKRTPAELDFTPVHKPAMVVNIVDARVSVFINNERSFTFQLDTEEGGHYLLQALDKGEMKKWVDIIERVSKTAAKRRLTYMGQNSKVQMSDHLLGTGAAPRDPRAVFGVELETLLQRESPGGEPAPGAIPSVIHRLIDEVEMRGLTEVGIYRVAGAHSEVGALRDALNKGEWPIDSYTDINAVCDLIKSWFRVLPGGMFPAPTHVKIMDVAGSDDTDLDSRIANVRTVVHELPRPHFDLLKRLVEHLDKVTDFEENNQMTADSLATVFSPNLIRSANDDVGFFFAHMSKAHRATKMLISHAHVIFNEVEPDLDADHEAESEDEYDQFDAPIPEEDEEEDELRSADHETEDEDTNEGQTAIVTSPPILDFELPSPCDLSIPMPS